MAMEDKELINFIIHPLLPADFQNVSQPLL